MSSVSKATKTENRVAIPGPREMGMTDNAYTFDFAWIVQHCVRLRQKAAWHCEGPRPVNARERRAFLASWGHSEKPIPIEIRRKPHRSFKILHNP